MLKISIITICFNNAKTIRRTIESVISQSYSGIEYIIVDGDSKDGTLDIIREYKDKISKFISEKDKNLYDAINKGMKMATGDIVGLIHAGDRLFNTEVIQKIANHFATNDIDIMYGNSLLVNDQDVPVRVNISPGYSRSLIRRGWMPSHQSIYVKRPLLEKIGYYNLDLHPSSDYEFFLRYFYFNKLKVKKLNEFILKFSMGGISTRNYVNNIRGQKQHVECWTVNGEKPPFYLVPMKLLRKPRQFVLAAWYRFTGKYKRL
jgi:glycosyltransferase involved in cell wall biosynthesis